MINSAKFHKKRTSHRFLIFLRDPARLFMALIGLLLLSVPTSQIYAQTAVPTSNSPDLGAVLAALGIVIAFGAIPLLYYFRTQPVRQQRAVLVVSTDQQMQEIITSAIAKAGCQAVMAYRYEDALSLLNRNTGLQAVILDDSVPQNEAGIFVSSLSAIVPVRPLLLILDSRDVEHTKLSYRAEVVLTRPVNRKALEDGIRQVINKAELAELASTSQ